MSLLELLQIYLKLQFLRFLFGIYGAMNERQSISLEKPV